MKLGLVIPEVNILCVKLQDSRPPQVIFFSKMVFLFQEYAFSLREQYPPLQNFEVRTLVPPLIPKFLLHTPFNPTSLKKIVAPPPPSARGYDRRSKRYKYRSWKGGSICLEFSAESREYVLTYFWRMGTYFYWEDVSIYSFGRWVEIFRDESPPPPPPWICTLASKICLNIIILHENMPKLYYLSKCRLYCQKPQFAFLTKLHEIFRINVKLLDF